MQATGVNNANMVRLARVELATYRLGGGCSILLSYRRKRKPRLFRDRAANTSFTAGRRYNPIATRAVGRETPATDASLSQAAMRYFDAS